MTINNTCAQGNSGRTTGRAPQPSAFFSASKITPGKQRLRCGCNCSMLVAAPPGARRRGSSARGSRSTTSDVVERADHRLAGEAALQEGPDHQSGVGEAVTLLVVPRACGVDFGLVELEGLFEGREGDRDLELIAGHGGRPQLDGRPRTGKSPDLTFTVVRRSDISGRDSPSAVLDAGQGFPGSGLLQHPHLPLVALVADEWVELLLVGRHHERRSARRDVDRRARAASDFSSSREGPVSWRRTAPSAKQAATRGGPATRARQARVGAGPRR